MQRKFDDVKTHIHLKHMRLWQEKTGIKARIPHERTLDMPIIPREFDLQREMDTKRVFIMTCCRRQILGVTSSEAALGHLHHPSTVLFLLIPDSV